MALPSLVRSISVDLSDVDRGAYATFAMKVAQHPSESDDHLVGRVLAFCLEHREGIEFSRGVSSTDEPAIMVRDLTGVVTDWIEMGTPSAERLHKASKAVRRVAVYMHRAPQPWLSGLAGERIHRVETIDFVELDRELVAAMVARLDRRMDLAIAVNEGRIYATVDGTPLEGDLVRHRIGR
jgi:uncharacterized protein YaeQ